MRRDAPISHAIEVDHFGGRPADAEIAIFSADPGSSVEVRNTAGAVVFVVPSDGGSIQSKETTAVPTEECGVAGAGAERDSGEGDRRSSVPSAGTRTIRFISVVFRSTG
jgi:hypothetical protein